MMKLWKPSLDAVVTFIGAVLCLVLVLHSYLPSQVSSVLGQAGTYTLLSACSSLILLFGVGLGILRHKEASPVILAGVGILSLFVTPVIPSIILTTIGVIAFIATAIISLLFRNHSLDIPQAPSLEDLMRDAV